MTLLGASGCARQSGLNEEESDPIRVIAKVRVSGSGGADVLIDGADAPEPLDLRRIREVRFLGEGRSDFPANSSGEVQGRTVALAAARREALRALADEVMAFDLEPGGPRFGERVAERVGGIEWLESLTETAAEIRYLDEAAQTGIRARAELSGLVIAEQFPFTSWSDAHQGKADPRIGQTALPTDEEQAGARQRALERARAAIRDELLAIETNFGNMRELIDSNAEARERFDVMIDSISAEKVEFTDEGLCVLTAVFDRNQALALIVEYAAR